MDLNRSFNKNKNIPKGNVIKSHMPSNCPKQITLSWGAIPFFSILKTKNNTILTNKHWNYNEGSMKI